MELLNLLWLVAIVAAGVWILGKLLKDSRGGGTGHGGDDYALWSSGGEHGGMWADGQD